MAEIGIASGLITLSQTAFSLSRLLYDEVSNFKSRRRVVQDVLGDVKALVVVTSKIKDQVPTDTQRFELLRRPLYYCITVCQEMQASYDACMAGSSDEQPSIRQWINFRFRQKEFQDMKDSLSSFKSTLCISFELIQMQERSITQDSLNALESQMTGTKEDIEDQIDKIHQIMSTADSELRDILQEDRARLEESLEAIKEGQKRAAEIHPRILLERNKGDQDSRTIFGTDTAHPQFGLTVADNQAGVGAVMSAGVHSPEALRVLLENSNNRKAAVILESLQAQTQGGDAAATTARIQNLLEDANRLDEEDSRETRDVSGVSRSDLLRQTSVHGNER